MKRKNVILLIVFCLLFSSGLVLAEELEEEKDEKNNILNIYKIDDTYAAGLKLPVEDINDNLLATANLEYGENKGAEIKTGLVYRIPDIVIFDFYGGGGIGVDSKDRNLNPYVTLGSDFLFFFQEARYCLRNDELKSVNGFSFEF